MISFQISDFVLNSLQKIKQFPIFYNSEFELTHQVMLQQTNHRQPLMSTEVKVRDVYDENNDGGGQFSPQQKTSNINSADKLKATQNQYQPSGNQLIEKNSNRLVSGSKPIQKESNKSNLLAQRPVNIQQCQSHHKIPSLPQQTNNKTITSKTSQNFYVSTSKKVQKIKSSQKIFLTKINQPQQKEAGLTGINNQTQQITDITVLILLHKVIERMRQRGDDMTLECLVNQQKLIHISMAFLEKRIVNREQIEGYFSLEKEIIAFVQKINKVTMENFKEQDHIIDIKIFSKAVDLLMTPNMNRYVKDLKTLGKIKVLTFNNLACIYKKKKKFGIALRSVSFALQIEQALLNQQTNEQKYDIIPTYLNKAAILSQMKKHEKAIEQIMKSQKFIEKIEKQVIKQITEAQNNQNQELKKRLQEKRYYGLYMKMIINYNMGAEKEHMKMNEAACEYYKQGRQLALMINNDFMVKKFEYILNKIMEGRKK